MAKLLASEGLMVVAEGTIGPAAIRCAQEAVELVSGCERKHDGERVVHEVLHDGITESGVRVLIDSFSCEEIIGVLEFCITVVDVGGDEEVVAIDFCGVVGVDSLKVVCKEFGDDPVGVWLV